MLRSIAVKSTIDARSVELAERLQSYMRSCAGQRYEVVRVPPFTAYFHPFDAMVYFNYAIPDADAGARDAGAEGLPLEKLRAVFRARGRTPRFEYIDAIAPDLEAALLSAGFRREADARLMVCTPETYTPAPLPDDLSITILTSESPVEEFRLHCATGRQAFSHDAPISLEEAEKARSDLKNGRALLGRIGEEPAAVGLISSPEGGFSELAGVGTLSAFRGRGFGAAIVSRAASEAFANGVETLFLATITEDAGRLYERVGFRFLTTMLFCIEATAEATEVE